MGLIAFTSSQGPQIRLEMFDGKGQPTPWNGISAIVTDHDSFGNSSRITNLASDGQPVRDANTEWSVQDIKRNEHGEVTQRTFFKAQQDGSLKQISHSEISYDDFGHPADIKFAGIKSWHSALHYDVNGNVTEETFLDVNGKPLVGDNGYAITRSSYTANEKGLRVEQTYFDASGNNH